MNDKEKTGAELIAEERKAQWSREDYSDECDDEHDNGELALAAVCYAAPCKIYHRAAGYQDPWPWGYVYDKREKHSPIRRLVIAGALIAAEIDRLKRLESQ